MKNKALLDREVRPVHTATLQATDTSGKPGTTVLEITLTDINDQPPVMNRESYLVFVEEGSMLEVKIEVREDNNSLIIIVIIICKLILIFEASSTPELSPKHCFIHNPFPLLLLILPGY